MDAKLTFYGPAPEQLSKWRSEVEAKLKAVFPLNDSQIATIIETIVIFGEMNHIDIHRRNNGYMVIHVYNDAEGVDCSFHTKIDKHGRYS